ncbi:UPF0158 family protein [Chloroflexota bacterium]
MGKKKLRINLNELFNAIEDGSLENDYFLDLETGEIIFVSGYMDNEDEATRKLKDRMEEEFDRYEQIPKVESHEGYEDMVGFIATVENERLAELLEVAINGKGAFRRFKDVLVNSPEESERWFKFKDDKIEERAREWLEDIDVIISEE